MLKRLSHEHLISLLATYQYHRHFHLIFPWAECDLRTYWEVKNPNPSHDIDTLLWMARQCEGIAEGLDRVHHHETSSVSSIIVGDSKMMRSPWTPTSPVPTSPGPARRASVAKPRTSRIVFGRHGDIKPTNLLWFPDPGDRNGRGTIKISDFGAAEFNTVVSLPSASNSISHSLSYRPPECDLPDSIISTSYDIWTLGCLYLEFITWFMGGSKLLDEFRCCRRQCSRGLCRTNAFFEIVRDLDSNQDTQPQLVRVKPAVLEVSHKFISVVELDLAWLISYSLFKDCVTIPNTLLFLRKS
jgi:serine/threonine protein kinase